jgi:serine phosphatase RsbU (regulator of sigma subunit)
MKKVRILLYIFTTIVCFNFVGFTQQTQSKKYVFKGNLDGDKFKLRKNFIVQNEKIIYDYLDFVENPIDTSKLPDNSKGVKLDLVKNNSYWVISSVKFNDSLIGAVIPINVRNKEDNIIFFNEKLVYSGLRYYDEGELFSRVGQMQNVFYYLVEKPRVLVLYKVGIKQNSSALFSGISELNYKYNYFKAQNKAIENYFMLICTSVLFSFGLLFLFIFIFSRKGKYNLYFSLFSMLIAGAVLYVIMGIEHFVNNAFANFILAFLIFLIELFLLLFLKEFINYGINKISKVIIYLFLVLSIITLVLSFGDMDYFMYLMLTTLFIGAFEVVRIIILGLLKKKKEARIVSFGLFLSICFFMYPLLVNLFSPAIMIDGDVDTSTIYMSIAGAVFPVFMGISLAKDFVSKSKLLEVQILTIQNLSNENLNKEREKQEIILKQKENLEIQVVERTKEVVEQKHVIEEKQKEIIDSINYAKRIQTALLASDKLLSDNMPDYFVLFKPKDIVAGDFYWAAPSSEGFIYITADCTGHGVPGAFMSLLNISKLNEAINQKNIVRPDLIFNDVRSEIIKALNPEGTLIESKDGMDAIICKLNIKQLKLEFSAANNSFYIVRNNELLVCKADKMPVGKGHIDDSNSFTYNEIALEKGDVIYTFTDGYADQFGGPKGKKFKYKQMEDLMLLISKLPMPQQKETLHQRFEEWRGDLEQVDDVLIIGVRV